VTAYRLDVPELHRRLDAQRIARGMSWRGVGRECGLPVSSFTRIGHGRSIEADALVTLLVWLEMDTDVAYLIKPGDEPVICPGCERPYQPNRDGEIRRHGCETEAGQ
jgi:hypothetical protein